MLKVGDAFPTGHAHLSFKEGHWREVLGALSQRAGVCGEVRLRWVLGSGVDRSDFATAGDQPTYPAALPNALVPVGNVVPTRRGRGWAGEIPFLLFPEMGLKPSLSMASTPVINLRKGHAVRYNNEVCLVSDFELKTPPRMASYVQMSVRTLSTGKVYNLRMTSNESLEAVNLNREPHEYSYKDGEDYHFMHPETFEDVVLMESQVKNAKDYLIEGQKYTVQFADDVVIGIELPPSVVMTVTESPEGVKGDSANNVYKAAKLETGLVVQVPLFIGPGDKISVKTEDNSYLGRSN